MKSVFYSKRNLKFEWKTHNRVGYWQVLQVALYFSQFPPTCFILDTERILGNTDVTGEQAVCLHRACQRPHAWFTFLLFLPWNSQFYLWEFSKCSVSEVLWDYGACTWVGEIHTLRLQFLTAPFVYCLCGAPEHGLLVDLQYVRYWKTQEWVSLQLRVLISCCCCNKLLHINFLTVLEVRNLKYILWG